MYTKLDKTLRMTYTEASETYPDSFIIMQMDSMTSDLGTILYIGDIENEMISLLMTIDAPYCGVLIGLNHQRSLGGVVIGG